MENTFQKAISVILISLGLALVFNFLFFGKSLGTSVFIFNLILLAAVFSFGLRQQVSFKNSWWLSLPILFFALMQGIRANEFLSFLNICATFFLLMLLAHGVVGTPVLLMKLRDYLVLIFIVPFKMLARALSTISLLGQVHSTVEHRDVWVRVIKGVLMAVPILIVFGILFSQADLVFSKFISSFVHITISEHSLRYLALLTFAFVAGLSFLSYIFFPKNISQNISQAATSEKPEPTDQAGKTTEISVFLGLIVALFLLFIGFQITYLFGGEANIVNAGFTYAEYARRGFWELLVVALLSLLVLLAAEKYVDLELKRSKKFLVPALIMIAEVVVVIFSAFKRLSLYIDAYSMTILRFYVAGFIMLLLVLFILLAVKFIFSKREQFFTTGVLFSAITFLVVINIINPDAFVARSNIAQYNRTGKIDVMYVAGLSADAESWKIDLYKKLEGEDKEAMRALFQSQKDNLEKDSVHWQSTNYSRAQALKILQGR